MSNADINIPELYTKIGSKELVINGMQPTNSEIYVPLGFRTGKINNFTISGDFENCNNTQVILRDNITQTETDLTAGNIYYFASDIYDNTSRFTLKINTNVTGINTVNDNNVIAYVNNDNQVVLKANATNRPTAEIYNLTGQKLYEEIITQSPQTLKYQFMAGVYLVKIGNKTEKIVIK
jgi:hypothetical protein